jgi:hypothetical protein
MKIISTFAVLNESLFSVHFEHEDTHEFARLFNIWNEPDYLFNFFNENITDLQSGFWGDISIPEAIEKTRREANELEAKILAIARTGQTKHYENLSSLFIPLSNDPCRIEPYEKSKARVRKSSWLRVYAIRLDINTFVVCGGAIKLTKTMNTRDHLKLELEKLEFTRNYLLDESPDALDFVELF